MSSGSVHVSAENRTSSLLWLKSIRWRERDHVIFPVVLGIELKTLSMLSKCSTTEPHPQLHLFLMRSPIAGYLCWFQSTSVYMRVGVCLSTRSLHFLWVYIHEWAYWITVAFRVVDFWGAPTLFPIRTRPIYIPANGGIYFSLFIQWFSYYYLAINLLERMRGWVKSFWLEEVDT